LILIFSKGKLEASTNDIIDWLEFYGASYRRINREDITIEDYNLDINKGTSNILGLDVVPDDVNVVWHRRWGKSEENYQSIKIENDLEFEETINRYLFNEYKGLSFALFNMFKHAYWLSIPSNRMQKDKIGGLRTAKQSGLLVPKTYILSSKKRLNKILNDTSELITKSIVNVEKINIDGIRHIPYTQIVNKEILASIPDVFFPSLFQEKIEKEYEIRTFYLEGDIYSMAIFSQHDNQTEVDFRKYNFEKPNRNIPYKLPDNIEKKLCVFMKSMDLRTGSIDIIKSIDGRYIFLEVNPVGQFGMVSLPCNYNLEKKMAQLFITKDNGQRFN